jgi:hypothetical protein
MTIHAVSPGDHDTALNALRLRRSLNEHRRHPANRCQDGNLQP